MQKVDRTDVTLPINVHVSEAKYKRKQVYDIGAFL